VACCVLYLRYFYPRSGWISFRNRFEFFFFNGPNIPVLVPYSPACSMPVFLKQNSGHLLKFYTIGSGIEKKALDLFCTQMKDFFLQLHLWYWYFISTVSFATLALQHRVFRFGSHSIFLRCYKIFCLIYLNCIAAKYRLTAKLSSLNPL
jgi:hypothetical protein